MALSLANGGLGGYRDNRAEYGYAGDLARADAATEAASLRAAADEDAAARNSGAIRGTGALTKYRPVGGWRTPGPGVSGEGTGTGTLRAAAETYDLGAPTSFKGGSGAPAPIGVIRGLRQTFAPPRQEGQQFIEGEYSTPLRAAQAYNRAAGVGEFEPVTGPDLRLRASLDTKNIDKLAGAQGLEADRAGKAFRNRLLSEYGVNDPEKGLVLPPYLEKLALRHAPTAMADVENSFGKFAPEAATEKQLDLFNNPSTREQTRVTALTNYRRMMGPNANPAEEERIKTAPITRENLKGFMDIYNQAAPAPTGSLRSATPGQTAADTGVIPGVMDRAALLGKTLGYELQPSLRKAGVPAPTLDSVRGERIADRQRIWDEEGNLRAGAPSAM